MGFVTYRMRIPLVRLTPHDPVVSDLPLPAEILGPDSGVSDGADGGGEGEAGDEEGVVIAGQTDGLLQIGVQP